MRQTVDVTTDIALCAASRKATDRGSRSHRPPGTLPLPRNRPRLLRRPGRNADPDARLPTPSRRRSPSPCPTAALSESPSSTPRTQCRPSAPPTPICSTCPPAGSSTAGAPRSSPTTSRGTSPRPGERVTRSSSVGSTTTPTSGPGSRPRSGPASPCAGSRSTPPPPSSTSTPIELALSSRTRLVAVTAASNVLGTKPPVRQIADRGARGRRAGVRRRRPLRLAPPGRRTGSRGRPVRLLPVQVPRPALRRACGRARSSRVPEPGQAHALPRHRAGAVRVRHPAVRAPGRCGRHRRLPRGARSRPARHAPGTAHAVPGRDA